MCVLCIIYLEMKLGQCTRKSACTLYIVQCTMYNVHCAVCTHTRKSVCTRTVILIVASYVFNALQKVNALYVY